MSKEIPTGYYYEVEVVLLTDVMLTWWWCCCCWIPVVFRATSCRTMAGSGTVSSKDVWEEQVAGYIVLVPILFSSISDDDRDDVEYCCTSRMLASE